MTGQSHTDIPIDLAASTAARADAGSGSMATGSCPPSANATTGRGAAGAHFVAAGVGALQVGTVSSSATIP